jgi:membrane protein implicated in regulation of membrane protease activity
MKNTMRKSFARMTMFLVLFALVAGGVFAQTAWTAVSDRTTGGYSFIGAVAYGGNRFIATGDNGKLAYSTNGTTWTAVSDRTINAMDISAIAYGGNRWVAGGEGKLAYSTDGARWTAVSTGTMWDYKDSWGDPAKAWINAIVWGGGRFVAVGDAGKMAYSSDGTTWTAVSNSRFPQNDEECIYGVTYGGDRFVAVGTNGRIAYSTNGQSWTAVSNSRFGGDTILAVAWGGNRFVALAEGGKAAYSTNGTTWTAASNTIDSIFPPDRGGTMYAVAWGNNRFVAVGERGKIAYSADGVRWTAVPDSTIWAWPDSPSDRVSINTIACGNNRFVVGSGDYAKMAYSDR